MKIIVYELNEIPWRVWDYYAQLKPHSIFAKLLQKSHQLTTITRDEGELHPWSTWPSVHRGVYNYDHNIRFINQKLPLKYPPLWEILVQHEIKTGVFGSLQSFPVQTNPNYCFYVPDTFSPSPETYPDNLNIFQRFNLAQTERDGAIALSVTINLQFIKDVINLLKSSLKFSTLFKLGCHFIKEQLNPDHKTYRSIMQAPVAFDFFYDQLKSLQPQFCTFFTNHLAGMQHRYWKYTFPNDFNTVLHTKRDKFLSRNIERALDIADNQLKQLVNFCDHYDYTLIVASSMGQESIDRSEYYGELRLDNMKKFYQGIGYSGQVQNNLAMQPDFAFNFDHADDTQEFKIKALKLTDEKGIPLFTVKEQKLNLNLSLKTSPHCVQERLIYMNYKPYPIKNFGINVIHRDPGTGYHQPQGIALFSGKHIMPSSKREQVESIALAPTILKAFNISKPSYMINALKYIWHKI